MSSTDDEPEKFSVNVQTNNRKYQFLLGNLIPDADDFVRYMCLRGSAGVYEEPGVAEIASIVDGAVYNRTKQSTLSYMPSIHRSFNEFHITKKDDEDGSDSCL
ncbi:hypothetical protein ACOME3_006501 [Neoechinorhynchus agilis]